MRPFALAALLLAGGCQHSPGSATGDMASNPDLVPLACNGTFRNSMNGDFPTCQLEITVSPSDDQSIQIFPRSYQPLQGQPPPDMVILNLVSKPGFRAQTYTLDTLADGSQLVVKSMANQARFFAGRVIDDMTMERTTGGTIELTLRALPVNPMTGNPWFDTNVHGSLVAQLPLDPNTPGKPGDRVDVAIEF